MGGIKLKVGGEPREDVARVSALRKALGDGVAIMVDVNQQWDRATARRLGRRLEDYDLVWIEEPLDAYDVKGHAALRATLDTPIATGEMLSSATDLRRFLEADAVDVLQPDAIRIGGITPYRRVADLADELNVTVAPHFATQLHVHLAACQPREGWVEWFDWLDPLFEERLTLRDGRVIVPERPDGDRPAGFAWESRALAGPALFSAIEVACLDAIGKATRRPVVDLLGGRVRDRVPFAAYLFFKHARDDGWGEVMTADALVAEARTMRKWYGFRSLKLKGGVLEPDREAEAILALREAFGPDVPLRL